MKRNGSHDSGLASRIQAFHICRGVSLRIAELLCLPEGILELHPVFEHFCEDIVGRPVHNAQHVRDLIGRKALLQRTDDRNPAGNGSLEEEILPVLLRRVQKDPSFFSDQILIGGDYVLARSQRLKDDRFCRLHTAHYLDDDLYLVILNDLPPVICQERRIDPFPLLIHIVHKYLLDLQLRADRLLHAVRTPADQLIHSCSHCSEP